MLTFSFSFSHQDTFSPPECNHGYDLVLSTFQQDDCCGAGVPTELHELNDEYTHQ